MSLSAADSRCATRKWKPPRNCGPRSTSDDWKLVLANYSMPRFSPPEALKVLRAAAANCRSSSFLIFSGEETAVAAIRAGRA